MSDKKSILGNLAIGQLVGFSHVKKGDYDNYYVALITGEYYDKYNSVQQQRTEFSVSKDDAISVQGLLAGKEGQIFKIYYRIINKHGIKNNKSWGMTTLMVDPERIQEIKA